METVCVALRRPSGSGFQEFVRSVVERSSTVRRARAGRGCRAGAIDVVLWSETVDAVEEGADRERPMATDWDAFLQLRFEDGCAREFVAAIESESGGDHDEAVAEVFLFDSTVMLHGKDLARDDGALKSVALWNSASDVSVEHALVHQRTRHAQLSLGSVVSEPLYHRYWSSGSLAGRVDHWDAMMEQWFSDTDALTTHARSRRGAAQIKDDERSFVGLIALYFVTECLLWRDEEAPVG